MLIIKTNVQRILSEELTESREHGKILFAAEKTANDLKENPRGMNRKAKQDKGRKAEPGRDRPKGEKSGRSKVLDSEERGMVRYSSRPRNGQRSSKQKLMKTLTRKCQA